MIEFNHPPDFGRFFSSDGNIANSVKGAASANENPNIPIMGLIPISLVASISSEPTKIPTHEKLTITNANAKKNDAKYPPFSAWLSAFVARLLGNIISNNPKNEKAKAMKRNPKIRFDIQ